MVFVSHHHCRLQEESDTELRSTTICNPHSNCFAAKKESLFDKVSASARS